MVRSTQDIIFVIISFIFHGPIGLGTLFIALGTGFFVHFWRAVLKKIILKKERTLKWL